MGHKIISFMRYIRLLIVYALHNPDYFEPRHCGV
jgi:hypothetical protein